MKTREVASALGISVSTLKRWVDSGRLEAIRTVGKHRLIRVSDALRFARDQGLPQSGLEVFAETLVPRFDSIDDEARAVLVEALREGRGEDARALIRGIHASGLGGVALADELIRPAMEQVGHGWQEGLLDVYQEHEASLVVASVLMEIVGETARQRHEGAPRAIGAASEGDPYMLPGMLGELVLREAGWDVRNLGVNLPLSSLANAVEAYRPGLVFLSVSYLADSERFIREYHSFHQTAVGLGAAVIVGGRALRHGLRTRIAFTAFGDRMSHLAEFARRLLPSPGPSTSPSSI